jgi:hypothetical protein
MWQLLYFLRGIVMWRQFLILVLASLSLASCGGLKPKSGEWAGDVRDFEPFQKLSISVPAVVTLTVGSERSRIELDGDRAVCRAIDSEIKDGTLIIDAKGKHLDLEGNVPLQLGVETPTLEAFSFSGAGKAYIEGLKGESFDFSSSGACSTTAKGKLTTLIITSTGASKLDFGEVDCKDVKLTASGASSAVVDATESLDVDVSGASSVRYKGHPKKVEKKVSGVSSIQEL